MKGCEGCCSRGWFPPGVCMAFESPYNSIRNSYRENVGNRGQNLFYQNKFCCRRRPKIIKILGQLRHVPLFPTFCLLLFLIKWCGLSKAIHTPGGNQPRLQHPSHPFIERPPIRSLTSSFSNSYVDKLWISVG